MYYLYPTDENIIMKTPAFPVFEGDKVILYCQYKTTNYNDTTFFKNGAVVSVMPSSPNNEINMTIENVTKKDEGSYKCASPALKMESTESWLSVRPKSDTPGQVYNLNVMICVYIFTFCSNVF